MKLIQAVFKKNIVQTGINDRELMANVFVMKCLLYTFAAFLAVVLLNLLHIFIIDSTLIFRCFILSAVIVACALLYCCVVDYKQKYVPYVLMLFLAGMLAVMETFMTYHAVLLSIMPLLCSVMYASKQVTVYTYVITVISTIVIVIAGYYYGVCDANMVLGTSTSLSHYIAEDGTFLLREISKYPTGQLLLYFAFPRCVILALLYPLLSGIVSIITSARSKADVMGALAETDEMTGLFNKGKYMRMVPLDFLNEERVAVIFWDANGLKHINDTMGHEKGDRLIISLCECVRIISDAENAPAFRIGGDEFIMIIRGGTPEIVQEKIELFNNYKNLKSRQEHMALSVSIGYACGCGRDIESLIKEADERMYEEKKVYHAEVYNR